MIGTLNQVDLLEWLNSRTTNLYKGCSSIFLCMEVCEIQIFFNIFPSIQRLISAIWKTTSTDAVPEYIQWSACEVNISNDNFQLNRSWLKALNKRCLAEHRNTSHGTCILIEDNSGGSRDGAREANALPLRGNILLFIGLLQQFTDSKTSIYFGTNMIWL